MNCIVCGKSLTDYALIGKKKDMKVTFCAEHLPDCAACDSCDLRCISCGKEVELQGSAGVTAKGEIT
jgi:hypothetical protein